jgi:hypothetical protein
MVAIAPPHVMAAQRIAAELQEALAERKAAALMVARLRERGWDDAIALAALQASTACVEALLLRLEILVPPADRLN